MRIALLTPVISPYHNARFRILSKLGFDLVVVATKNEAHFREFLASPSPAAYAVMQIFESKGQYDRAVADRLLPAVTRDVLARIDPDVLAVSGWYSPESFAALSFAREKRIPNIVMSESQFDDAERHVAREYLKRRIVSQFDAALVGGPSHAEYMLKLGIPRERIHYGYNAVDNAHFFAGAEAARTDAHRVRRDLGLPGRYILASARFIAKKNLPGLVHAYAEARKAAAAPPDLVILGNGPERLAVERAISESEVSDHVQLPGFRSYDVLPSIYGLSEGFVHVSNAEQWGLVINEAMASAVPVVASDCCGATRTVVQSGVHGFVTAADPASIADALGSLFRLTPARRNAMGVAASRAIADWGPDRFGAGMKAAVKAAMAVKQRDALRVVDRAILRLLENRVIDSVA